MKVWTELDMEPVLESINTKMRGQELKSPNEMTDEWWHLLDVRTTIEKNTHEIEDLTIYGYMIGDLVPLAWALRRKGVQAEEIEDWSRELRQMRETMQTAMSAELTDTIRAAVQDLMGD